MKLTLIVALVPLLAACASSGLYNMSDQWCATHLRASAARCPDDSNTAVNDKERVAKNDTRRVD
jgi:hypothetical protein